MNRTRKTNKIILGIDPGTRETGYALIGRLGLMDYGVKTFTNRGTRKEMLADAKVWLKKLVYFYEPQVLVVETSNLIKIRRSRNLKALINSIERIARARKIKIVRFAPTTVRKIICGDGWTTKKQAAHYIAMNYFRELRRYLRPRPNRKRLSRWQEDYWKNMFDAVALALAYKEKSSK
ncbi:hypothetical protein DRQ36_10035 [bacterium]|nr:MAG: hypothetical protein DRQ36_10035 [bacterium]